MDWRERIELKPGVMLGKPVVKGTRITVELLLDRLSDGWSENDLLESFPSLSREDIRAAYAFGSEASSMRQFLIGA